MSKLYWLVVASVLGVTTAKAQPLYQIGVKLNLSSNGYLGAEVKEMTADSAAARAGIQIGDVLYNLNGSSLSGAANFSDGVTPLCGRTVQVGLYRPASNSGTLTFLPVELPASTSCFGATMADSRVSAIELHPIDQSPAARAGLMKGDLVSSINGVMVLGNMNGFINAVQTSGASDILKEISISVFRNGVLSSHGVLPERKYGAIGLNLMQFMTPLRGVQIRFIEPTSSFGVAITSSGDKFQPGDVILRVNGIRVESRAALASQLVCGRTADIQIFREDAKANVLYHNVIRINTLRCDMKNLEVADGAVTVQYPLAKVTSVQPGSPAESGGVILGDVILEAGPVQQRKLLFGNANVFSEVVQTLSQQGAQEISLKVNRGQDTWEVSIPLREINQLTESTPPPAVSADGKVTHLRTAISLIQRTLKASGFEIVETGMWDATTLAGVTRALAELQQDEELWGLGWKGPKDGVYTNDLAEHLRVTFDALKEIGDGEQKEVLALMGPFLDALDLLKDAGVYKK